MEFPTIRARIKRSEGTLGIAFDGKEIFFQTIRGEQAVSPHDDFAVWALLSLAMHSGSNLHVEGSVHRNTLANAARYAYIWSTWLPDKIHPVSVSASQIREGEDEIRPAADHGAILTLSGGIDSVYALLSHRDEHRITHTLTVQGFDYPLNRPAALEGLAERTEAISRLAGVKNVVVKTNVRDYVGKWGQFFSLALAAVLYTKYGLFEKLLNARDYPCYYIKFVHPWGINFCSEYLFSISPGMMEFLDWDVERPRKIARVVRAKEIAKHVTVCWKDTSRAGNCGKCHKCLHTKIMARAMTGTARPIFEDDSISPEQVKQLIQDIRLGSPTIKAEQLSQKYALRVARERGDTEIAGILERFVEAADRPHYGRIRGKIVRLMRKLGKT